MDIKTDIKGNPRANTYVAWSALVLSIIGLIIGWQAYNRSGEDLGSQMYSQYEQYKEDADLAYSRLQARMELMAAMAKVQYAKNYDESAKDIADIRQRLKNSYANTTGEAKQEWQQIDQNLERLESQVRNKSVDALQGFQSLIDRLQEGIATDER